MIESGVMWSDLTIAVVGIAGGFVGGWYLERNNKKERLLDEIGGILASANEAGWDSESFSQERFRYLCRKLSHYDYNLGSKLEMVFLDDMPMMRVYGQVIKRKKNKAESFAEEYKLMQDTFLNLNVSYEQFLEFVESPPWWRKSYIRKAKRWIKKLRKKKSSRSED